MAALQESQLLSEEDFLAGELVSQTKHEYVAGRVYAMSGGTANHSAVASNFLRVIGGKTAGTQCRTFTGDLSIRVQHIEGASYFYPDASVICSPVEGSDQFSDDPVVVLEVLSPSTRRIDETSKLQGYMTLASLKVCLLAESDRPFVTVYRRSGEKFVVEIYDGEDVIPLPELDFELSLKDLYQDVTES